jgi:hypothetical protein
MQHWIIVATFDHARIFATSTDWQELVSVDELVHPEERVKAAELLTHPHGTGPYARPAHPPPLPHVDPLTGAREEFAHHLAQRVREGRTQGQFDQFVLIAPAPVLALVDAYLDADTAKRRVRSIARAIDHEAPEAIAQAVGSELAVH